MMAEIRKCLLRKWTDFNGYGFNLHAEKGKAGQYVGKVDEGSPAEASGLKEGDRIVEVNNVNIGNENHQQVVSRIKAGGDQVTLLVVDNEADEYFKSNKIVITDELESVKCTECPTTKPKTSNGNQPTEKVVSAESSEAVENDYEIVNNTNDRTQSPPDEPDSESQQDVSHDQSEELPPPPPELIQDTPDDNSVDSSDQSAPPSEHEPADTNSSVVENTENVSTVESPQPAEPEEPEVVAQSNETSDVSETPASEQVAETPASEQVAETPASEQVVETPVETPVEIPSEPVQNGNTEKKSVDQGMKMSAKEMREMLKQKKKPDPRVAKISAKQKHDMFQRL